MSAPASRIRLVVTDIDGTLVTPDKILTPRALKVAGLLRTAGIMLALVSSRPARGMNAVATQLGIDTPRAGFNGGEIVSPDGRVLDTLTIPKASARQAIETMAARGVDAWVFADNEWCITNPDGDYVPLERRTIGVEPKVLTNFDDVLGRAGKIMGSTRDFARLERVELEIAAALGADAAVHRSQDYYLDVTHPQARKDHALKGLARLLGVPIAEIAALGDMPNDTPMLRIAGLSIAMGNAPDDVKDIADLVTGTNEQDGWADAIERHVLPRAPGLH